MTKREYNIVKERLFWSYANLAMAHTFGRQYDRALGELDEFIQRYPNDQRLEQIKAEKAQLEEFLKKQQP